MKLQFYSYFEKSLGIFTCIYWTNKISHNPCTDYDQLKLQLCMGTLIRANN